MYIDIYLYIYFHICIYIYVSLFQNSDTVNKSTWARVHCRKNWPITSQPRPRCPRTHGSTASASSVARSTSACTGHNP